MKKFFFVSIVAASIAIFSSCNKVTDKLNKNKNGDLGGTENITGTAYILNTFNSISDTILLGNSIVKIKYSSQKEEFLYKAYTDQYGKFKFTNIVKDSSYIAYSSSETDSLPYYGEVAAKAGNDVKLILYPDSTKFNAAIITVVDGAISPINDIKVYRFINKTYFDNLILNFAIDSLVTSKAGIVTYYNQPPGKYYLYSTFSVNNQIYTGKQSIDIPNNGVIRETFEVK